MAFKMKDAHDSNELNFIGAGTYVEGNIETKGSLRIDGKVKGIVKSGDTLTVGSSGEIIGEVHVKNPRRHPDGQRDARHLCRRRARAHR